MKKWRREGRQRGNLAEWQAETPIGTEPRARARSAVKLAAILATLLLCGLIALGFVVWKGFNPTITTDPRRYAIALAEWSAPLVTHFPIPALVTASNAGFYDAPGPMQAADVMVLHVFLSPAQTQAELARLRRLASAAAAELPEWRSPSHWLRHFGSAQSATAPGCALLFFRSDDHENLAWVWVDPSAGEFLYFVNLQ